MSEVNPDLWQFGEFKLDVRRKILVHRDRPVAVPLKELEVLSMLVRNRGELVTKEELLNEIWEDSFVEESNLSRHIYLLRKTLKELGAADGLIENVPRRGYRFTGNASPDVGAEIVIEKHTKTRTLIEFEDESVRAKNVTPLRSRFFGYVAAVLVFAAASGFFASQFVGSHNSSREIRSIAVLPFNVLGEPGQTSHSGTGLADILTTRLSNLKNLKIRPAGAASAFERGDPVAAGQKLGVDAVLEGTMYIVDERVRVTARLINVADRSIIWSGDFEKLKKDELQIQHEIAVQIVPVIALNLSRDEREAIAKKYTENPDAYELYLRGRHEWNKRSAPGMIEAQRLFRNAVEADPNFALAYVGLADTLLTNQPAAAEAWACVTRALELDPNMAEAHASRGFYLMFLRWQWQDAEAAFKRSLELNPNYATAHHWYATLLSIRGDLDAAKSEMRKALELNPISHNFLADLGQLHYFAGEYAEAETYCLKALEIYPDFAFGHLYLHYIYLKTGQYEKAVIAIAKADAINGAIAYDRTKDDRLEISTEILRKSGINGFLDARYAAEPTSPDTFYLYAMKYAFTGDSTRALEYLEKSTDARMFLSAFVKAEPVFERLRGEPRYQKILRKMGLA